MLLLAIAPLKPIGASTESARNCTFVGIVSYAYLSS